MHILPEPVVIVFTHEHERRVGLWCLVLRRDERNSGVERGHERIGVDLADRVETASGGSDLILSVTAHEGETYMM